MRVPWTARRSNQSILKKINFEYSLALPQPAPSRARTLEAGERWARLAQARAASRPGHDEDLREPLVRRQGSQVSMRVARGSASLFSSHGSGLGPRDGKQSERQEKCNIIKRDARACRMVAGRASSPMCCWGQSAPPPPPTPVLLPGNLAPHPSAC